MTAKHNDINTEGKAKFRLGILRNNLVACLIHIAIFFFTFPWVQAIIFMIVDSTWSEIARISLIFAAIVVPLAGIYIYLGYRFMRPLPRLNFLSVLAPMIIFLLVNGLALFEVRTLLADAYYLGVWQTYPLNYIAVIISFSGYGFVMAYLLDLPNAVYSSWVHIVAMFVAVSFVPSLLMHLGILLKDLLQERRLDSAGKESVHDQQT